MKLKPLPHKVLIERIDEKPIGGQIVIPDAHRRRSNHGRVIAIDPATSVRFGLNPLDEVLLPDIAAAKVTMGKQVFELVEADAILAVLS